MYTMNFLSKAGKSLKLTLDPEVEQGELVRLRDLNI